jgi:hypothetical protein
MKASGNRLDKVEEALIAAHRRQEDLQLPPEWRQRVLEDIKAQPQPEAVPQEKESKAVVLNKFGWAAAAFSFAVLAAVCLILVTLDRKDPWVALKLEKGTPASLANFRLEAGDNESGLRNLTVTIIQKEIKIEVLAKDLAPHGMLCFPTGDVVKKVNIPLALNTHKLGLHAGEVTIIIVARDLSWNNGFAGNETTLKKTIYIAHNENP